MQAEDIRIAVPGLELAARAWGPEEGRPVLALHGWLDNAASFDTLAPLLSGLRLVALDMAGHGHSGHRPRGQHYHLVDFVADALHAAHALGWQRFSLLGHSLGAAIAGLAAAAAPEQIDRLMLLEGLGPLTEPNEAAAPRLLRSVTAMRELSGKRPPVYPDLRSMVRARKAVGDLSADSASRLCRRAAAETDDGLTWRSDPQLRLPSPMYLTEEQVLTHLGQIRCPVLCVIGAQGYLQKREFMAERYRQVADLRRHSVPGGHHMHLDDPAPTAALINDFMQASTST